MNILYVGPSGPNTTSFHRARALRTLGHTVYHFDPLLHCPFHLKKRIPFHLHQRTGFRAVNPFIAGKLKNWVNQQKTQFDVAWVNSGEWINEAAINILKKSCAATLLYTNDDPTGGRDGRRFDALLANIKRYDLCVVVRESNVREYVENGARRVLRVFMSYDEVLHNPMMVDANLEHLSSDVCFIGTWEPERGVFMKRLIDLGIPLSIWGERWHKATEWPLLRDYWRGKSLAGSGYVSAISFSKICLGLLSKGNRDLHTTRSLEIPSIGGLLCAQRTTEHLSMFQDGEEAVLWDDAEECAESCHRLLNDAETRERIRSAGHRRVKSDGRGNEVVMARIMDELMNQTSTMADAML
jgi:hypothetical protein